jgi:hypothetical protein
LLADQLDAIRIHGCVLVYEVVIQGPWFLAKEVDVISLPGERAAQVLDVDVASGAGEHVAVSHQDLHSGKA